jgi:cell division protease FtsH
MALPGTDPVQKVSIIPRGIAALGYTMQVPTEDRFLMRKTELKHRIATLLGGRAAEALIFNDISTGAQNDLSRATDIARSMVTQYGMSARLGQVYFAHQQPPHFLAAMGENRGQYSDETAKTIDEEVKRIIDDQYQIALQILKDNRNLLAETAGQLLQDEVIDGNDLTALAEAVKPASNVQKPSGTQSDAAALAA